MKTTTMKTLVLGLAVSGAALAQGGGAPRLGTTFDKRMATNELGTATLASGVTTLPVSAFVADGHGGWALDGSAFADTGVALYVSTGTGWIGDLSGNDSADTYSDWVLSLRAKVGAAADQVLWYLCCGSPGGGVFLRTVANDGGGLDLSLEWTGGAANPPYANVVLENVDTANFHHYVVTCSQTGGLKFFVDGEQKWSGGTVTAYGNADGTTTQNRALWDKSYRSLWLGRVESKTNVGTGAWTTVYDDVRFYSTNATEDSYVPTADEIVELTETVKAQRVLPALPTARLTVNFSERTLADTADVIEQVGADTLARTAFRKEKQGGYTLDAARLPDGQQGVCLYQYPSVWDAAQPLCGNDSTVTYCSYAVSLVAKIAAVDGAAVCYLRCGNPGTGVVLFTVANDGGGTDLAFTYLWETDSKAYPNILATNIDTENYHHYVLTCSRAQGGSTRPIRLWIDNCPVDLFTGTNLTVYRSGDETATRTGTDKAWSGLYLAAARGAKLACTAASATRFGDVRFFANEDFTDGYGPCAISPEGIDVLYRTLMPYADAPAPGAVLIIR